MKIIVRLLYTDFKEENECFTGRRNNVNYSYRTEKNMGKYLLMAEKEDVYITKNGKMIAKLTSPFQNKMEIAESLFGILPKDMTLEEAERERREKI